MKRYAITSACLLAAALFVLSAVSWAQEPAAETPEIDAPATPVEAADAPAEAPPDAAAADAELALTQNQIRDKFERLEEVLQRMAELTAANDPQRAALLRKALQQGKDDLILTQMGRLVELLQQERLAAAAANQQEVQQDLVRMLELLLTENRGQRLASEMARYKEYLKRVNKLIKDEEALRDQTARGADGDALARRQADVAEKTRGLADDIRRNEEGETPAGPPQEGEPQEGETQPGEQQPGEEGAEGQPSEGQPQPSEGQPSEGEPQEGQPQESEGEKPPRETDDPPEDAESEPQEGEPQEGQLQDAQPSEGQPSESQPSEGQPSEGPPSESQPSQGQPSQGQPSEGQPSDGDSQSQQQSQEQQEQTPARNRIEAAERKMREAQQKLEKAEREQAQEDQEQAIKELEQAKAELEEILRQLREEQIARTLKQLEARFQEMLVAQLEVYEGTLRLDRVPEDDRDRNHLIEAGRQSRREAEIVAEADKALALLHEEASSVAIPEAIEQMREDMVTIVEWLAEGKVGELTQGVEEDVIAALEEMLDALDKAQREQEKRQQQQQPPQPSEPQDQPLVDKLAELKMIRALQMRVNKRTERYSQLIDGEQAADPDLLRALGQLSDREERVRKATRDIAVGRNE